MKTIKAAFAFAFLPCFGFAFTNNDTARTATSDGSAADTQAALNYIDAKNQDGPMLRKMGLSSALALVSASSPQGNQSTGLWACCSR